MINESINELIEINDVWAKFDDFRRNWKIINEHEHEISIKHVVSR